MRWKREFNDDRSASWLSKHTPAGEFSVGYNPHLGGRTLPFTVTWYPAKGDSDGVRIGYAATARKGQAMVRRYLEDMTARFTGIEPTRYTITEAGRAMLRDAQQSSPDRQQGE